MKKKEKTITEYPENRTIYQYVEELIYSYQKYVLDVFTENKLSQKEYILLTRIRYLKHVSQKELADQYNLTEGYTAKLLRNLEEYDLITRIENPENRRKKLVSLTEKGQEYTDKIQKITSDWEESVTSEISSEEYMLLKSILNKML